MDQSTHYARIRVIRASSHALHTTVEAPGPACSRHDFRGGALRIRTRSASLVN